MPRDRDPDAATARKHQCQPDHSDNGPVGRWGVLEVLVGDGKNHRALLKHSRSEPTAGAFVVLVLDGPRARRDGEISDRPGA